jgi:hypothetical protein
VLSHKGKERPVSTGSYQAFSSLAPDTFVLVDVLAEDVDISKSKTRLAI